MRFIAQKKHNECGLACLLMILEEQRYAYTYKYLRNISTFSSFHAMYLFLNDRNIDVSMFMMPLLSLTFFPVVTRYTNKNRKHFIVIWEIENQWIVYSDPANLKVRKKKISHMIHAISTEFLYILENPNEKLSIIQKRYFPYKLKFGILLTLFCWIIYQILILFGII